MDAPVLGAVLLPSPKAPPQRVTALPALEHTAPLALEVAASAAAGGPPGQDPTGVIDISAAEAEEAPSPLQGS